MSVRPYLRSPVAIGWTLVGAVAIGTVVAAALRLAALAERSTLVADPATAVGGFGFVLTLAFATVTIAVAALVWLPCSLAVAHAVGNRHRGRSVSIGESIDRVSSRVEPMYRWVKTRIAIEPIADRVLSENDVSPAEVAVGCDAFVVPAMALDAPTLRMAVDRANRAIPRPGRERTLLVGIGLTGLLVAGAVGTGAVGGAAVPSVEVLALGATVLGAVLTAALDTAWRAGVYARQDPDEGFN